MIIRQLDRETVFSVRLQVVDNGADGVVAKAATLVEVTEQKVWALRWCAGAQQARCQEGKLTTSA